MESAEALPVHVPQRQRLQSARCNARCTLQISLQLATSRGGYKPRCSGNCFATDRVRPAQKASLHTRRKARLRLRGFLRRFCQKVGLQSHSLDVKLRFKHNYLCRVTAGFPQAYQSNQLDWNCGGQVVRFRVESTRSCPACCEDGPLLLALFA